jgi:uncharacterized ion transporter superfamily protein YfcC
MDELQGNSVANEEDDRTSPCVLTPKTQEINDANVIREDGDDKSQARIRFYLTIFVLSLFFLIVVYGLVMQNYWIVGIGCLPLVRSGVNRIFDRYL